MSMEMAAIQSEPRNYQNETHTVKVFEMLQTLRKDQVLCDIRLQTDDGIILFGHKVVLISASPYFYAMLSSFKESTQDLVYIREFDSTALQLLIDYIYTGKIMITEQNVQVLLRAANLLQFEYVKDACGEFMKTKVNPSNCISVKGFADIYNCRDLLSSCDHYIKNQFLEVVKHEEFLSLSSEEVIEIISSNDLAVQSEEKVFECVMNWVKHDLNGRNDSLPKLLEHVRLPLAPIEFISETVVREPLLQNSPQCKDFVIEALNFHVLKSQLLKTVPQTIRTKHRRSGQIIIGFSNSGVNWYDPATNLWQIAPSMSDTIVVGPVVLIKKHFLFSVGGHLIPHSMKSVGDTFSSDSIRSVAMLDLSLQSPCWVKSVDMLVKRKKLGVGVLNECIYAVGGFDDRDDGGLSSVEMFDSRIQKWKMVSRMSRERFNLGIGILNNRLYAVGGEIDLMYCYENSSALSSVECYDPSLDKWSPIAEMSESRCGHGVEVVDGVMYAIGGYNNNSGHLKSVEAFRPSTGLWSSITDMNMCRDCPGVFVLEGLLYVVGGKNQEGDLKSMEIYNPNTNTWSIEPLPITMGEINGGVVVNRPSHFRTN